LEAGGLGVLASTIGSVARKFGIAAMIAKVFGFGFCAAATSKNPCEKLTEGSGPPVGAMTKYLA